MERAGRHEEHVVGLHHPVLRLDVRPLDDRQQVALHPFARDVGTAHLPLPSRDLVDLVKEDDPQRLHALERVGHHVIEVDQLVELLVEQDATRLAHRHGALLRLLGHEVRQHLGEVAHPLRRALLAHRVHHRRLLRDLHLHLALLELPVAQELLELLARALVALLREFLLLRHLPLGAGDEHPLRIVRRGRRRFRRGREQQVEQPLVHSVVREVLHLLLALRPHHVDRALHEVSHHALDVAPHVAHLGELRRLHLDERGPGELREPPRDLRLPHARRADEDDVVRRDLVADPLGARWRRHRFRSAIATAFFASACPTMYRSSSATILRGDRSARRASACSVRGDAIRPRARRR
jgi:hypothetical protein